MGSATRSSLSAIDAAVAALGAKATAKVGAEVLDAAAVFASSGQLRAVLTDPAIDPAAKRSLIDRVLPKASAAARSLVADHTALRWSSDDDLVDALEHTGIRLTSSGHENRVLEDLFRLENAIGQNPELELALGSRLGDGAAKAALIDRVLGSAADEATVTVLSHLVAVPRGRRLRGMIRDAIAAVSEQAGVTVVTVTVARPLSAKQRASIESSLAARYGSDLKLHEIIDPAVLGGVRIQVGGDVIDGTVASRINDLRLQLA